MAIWFLLSGVPSRGNTDHTEGKCVTCREAQSNIRLPSGSNGATPKSKRKKKKRRRIYLALSAQLVPPFPVPLIITLCSKSLIHSISGE